MDPAQIGNWIAFAALLVTVVGSAVAFAFKLGELSNKVQNHGHRLKALEEGEGAGDARYIEMVREVAKIGTKVETFEQSVRHLAALVEAANRGIAALTTSRRRGAVPPLADALTEAHD